jgi:glycerophosphoryl diester phosphodiesterase
LAKTKIYAHRGASGWDTKYAPENTMPAFEKAIKMGADGIELDVQLTKDSVIVICHDERIDRTSDGIGWLKDYTLKELREFSFSKTHPEYGDIKIPTLREFLEFFTLTGKGLNIELKTGLFYY